MNHFSDREIACKCCGSLGPLENALRRRTRLNRLRDLVGRPIVVVSGYRCKKNNEKAGGALKSQHMIGDGSDVRCPGMSIEELYKICEADPFLSNGGLAFKKGAFVHLDGGLRRRWEYV